MTELLPITITPCGELTFQFDNIKSVTNKLEAEFNFHTMTANWYGDEEDIIFIHLHLNSPPSFIQQQEIKQQAASQHQEVTIFSDDVFSYYQPESQTKQLICHIAITATELVLLEQQNKLLAALLQIKLQKVLNLIADQLILPAI